MAHSRQPRDFDEWRLLAISDPEGFEAARRKVLDEVIAQAPENRRHRLKGLQWRVDRVRERSTSPLAACISLSGMMWESLAGENGLLDVLRGEQGVGHHEPKSQHSTVIQLHKEPPRQR